MSADSVLLNTRLSKTDELCQIRRLRNEDISAVTALHRIILANLKPGRSALFIASLPPIFKR